MQQITQNVLEFWFGDPPANAAREMWFKSGPELDEDIRARFLDTHALVKGGGFDAKAKTAEDFLAAVIVLNQFPRNMFRGTAEAFATDGLAREWSDRAIAAGHHLAVPAPHMRIFFICRSSTARTLRIRKDVSSYVRKWDTRIIRSTRKSTWT